MQLSECELLQSKTASQSDNINNDSPNEAVIEDTSLETVQKETSKNQSVSEPSVQKNKNNIMLNGDKKEEIQNDSVNLRSPSPVLDERSRRSLRCCVDGVSSSPYTSGNLQTDGQPKVDRGFPSIDD